MQATRLGYTYMYSTGPITASAGGWNPRSCAACHSLTRSPSSQSTTSPSESTASPSAALSLQGAAFFCGYDARADRLGHIYGCEANRAALMVAVDAAGITDGIGADRARPACSTGNNNYRDMLTWTYSQDCPH